MSDVMLATGRSSCPFTHPTAGGEAALPRWPADSGVLIPYTTWRDTASNGYFRWSGVSTTTR